MKDLMSRLKGGWYLYQSIISLGEDIRNNGKLTFLYIVLHFCS